MLTYPRMRERYTCPACNEWTSFIQHEICANCKRRIDEGARLCSCGRMQESDWDWCPYCGAQVGWVD